MRVWIGTELGGGIADPATAGLSVLDHGALLGDGLFETVLTRAGIPVALGQHLTRLHNSATALGFKSVSDQALRAAIVETLDADDVRASTTGRLRITVTSGAGPLGMSRGAVPTIIVLWESFTPSSQPLTLVTSSQPRWSGDGLLAHKHTSWLSNVISFHEAKAAGASDALLLNERGEVLETTTANIFAIKDQTLITPLVSSGCLPGVTRQLLIDCLTPDIRFAQMSFSREDLLSCDEVFVTSSLRLIQPVSQIDGTAMPRCGEFATKLMALLEQNLESADV